ncbi:hypothetical protein ASH00_14630 [Arthrobacter sp. Soil782]|nr:hypothetical protein ASH00_14630 [Arthrobacter sp. Soil782]
MGGVRLKEAWAEAQKKGWSTGTATNLETLLFEARLADWEEVETRNGQGTTTVLRPTTQAAAPYPRSISAVYGLDEQPLHVDGAHTHSPPDAVLLFCEEPNETPTNVLSIKSLSLIAKETGSPVPYDSLHHGLFVIGSGPAAFLAPALESGLLRYDPNVMEPADFRARRSAAYLASMQDRATAFEWTTPMCFLLIANRLALHGRAKVDESDVKRKVSRVAFRVVTK